MPLATSSPMREVRVISGRFFDLPSCDSVAINGLSDIRCSLPVATLVATGFQLENPFNRLTASLSTGKL